VLRKDDSEWVKKCMEFVGEGVRPRGRPKRTWKEVVEGDMKSLKLKKEDALVRGKWRRLITDTEEDSDDSGGLMCQIVSGTGSPGLSWIKGP